MKKILLVGSILFALCVNVFAKNYPPLYLKSVKKCKKAVDDKNRKDSVWCNMAGEIIANEFNNDTNAIIQYKRGCDGLDDFLSCHACGSAYYRKHKVQNKNIQYSLVNINNSIKYLTKACVNNFKKSCYALARVLIEKGDPKSYHLIKHYLVESCKLGNKDGCNTIEKLLN